MKITQEANGDLTTLVTLQVEEGDYSDQVKKTLNRYRKEANIPGFRPGKVPFGMVKKMYGEAVTADVVSNLIGEELDKYIREEKLDILGQPLPNTEKQKPVDFKNETEFTFYYDLGIKPEINLELNDKIKVTRYEIKVDDDTVDKYLEDIRLRFGEQSNPDEVADGDLVMGTITQLDDEGNALEGGIVKDLSIDLKKIKLKTIKNKFIGKKKGAKVVFNIKKAFKDDVEVASLLGITREEAEKMESDFQLEIKDISRITPAELNEELFKKVYEHDDIKTEEELRERIRRDVEESFKAEGDRKFYSDVTKELIKKTDLKLPDEFLKRWIIESNMRESEDKRISPEELNAQYDSYRDTLRWQLIEEYLVKQNELFVTEEEIRNRVKEILGLQAFGGDMGANEEVLNQVTDSVMQNQEEVRRVSDQIIEQKMTKLFHDKIKVANKKISYDDFVKMVNEEMVANAAKA
jgi:trigger factor